VRLTVHDVTGRRVRRLLDEQRSAGAQSLRWDGRDDDGRALGSGLYLARLRAAGTTASVKLLLIK
jgi:flagellar hook assembly protein FlgD